MLAFVTLLILAVLRDAESLQWSAGPADGVTVYVCEGQDLTLPWDITTDPLEQIIDITWFFHGRSDQMIAEYINSESTFTPSPSYSQRVQYLANGGITLSHVTPGDNGKYTIDIKVFNQVSGESTFRKSVTVQVLTESAAHPEGVLELRQEPRAAHDQGTGQFHVQLTCTSHTSGLSSVTWVSSRHETFQTTGHTGNTFILLLPNPLHSSNVSCRVVPDSPGATCFSKDDPAVLEGASVYVDKDALMEARLARVEGDQIALSHENDQLKGENSDFKLQVAELKDHVQDLEEAASRQVIFHSRLGSNPHLNHGDRLIPSVVSVNIGNAYNSSSGEFTVPFNGTYFFTATAGAGGWSSSEERYARLSLYVENRSVSYISSRSVDYYEQGTCSYADHLKVGQRVWLESNGNGYFHSTLTTFSGFLVNVD